MNMNGTGKEAGQFYAYLMCKLEQHLISTVQGKMKGKKKLRQLLVSKQKFKCALSGNVKACHGQFQDADQIEIDRVNTRWNFDPEKNFGYFEKNCRAVHAGCHRRIVERRDTWKVPDWLKKRSKKLQNQVRQLLVKLSVPPNP